VYTCGFSSAYFFVDMITMKFLTQGKGWFYFTMHVHHVLTIAVMFIGFRLQNFTMILGCGIMAVEIA
jgi:hypothetical protein